jgi:signal transduction histidine kinase
MSMRPSGVSTHVYIIQKSRVKKMAVSAFEIGPVRKAVSRFLSAQASVLGIGFTGLLLLMAVMAIDTTRSLRDVEVTTAALRTDSRKRDSLLGQLRLDIFRSSTVVSDYLLEPDGARAASQKVEMKLLHARIDDILFSYEQKLPDSEKDAFKDMRGQVESYWKSLAPALEWDAAERRTKGGSFLQGVVMPLRRDVVQLTRQVTDLNDRDLDTNEDRIRAVQSRFQRRLTIMAAAALVLGLILASVSIRRVQRLEWEAKSRLEEMEEARGELVKLSGRLVSAQEEERRNLSRELHDEVGQAMSAMLIELGRLETASDSETRSERLASVRRMAEANVVTVRNMALLLRPSMLDDLGLVAALRWQAREVTRRSGLKVKMIADEFTEDLPDTYRTCLYRVVQEALNNCAKHSQATQVHVVVHRDQDGLAVTVQDDGSGFEPGQEKGMGLLGMEERVVRLGGQFSLESKPNSGTVLRIYFPLGNDGTALLKDIE